jgi:hypothetical protein
MPVGGPRVCERRGAVRHRAHLVAKIRPATREREYLGVTRNIGITGTLLLTRAHFATGQKVEIELFIGESRHTLCGRVVRATLLDRTRIGVWKSEAAVEFDETLFDLEPHLRDAARKQAVLASGRPPG